MVSSPSVPRRNPTVLAKPARRVMPLTPRPASRPQPPTRPVASGAAATPLADSFRGDIVRTAGVDASRCRTATATGRGGTAFHSAARADAGLGKLKLDTLRGLLVAGNVGSNRTHLLV